MKANLNEIPSAQSISIFKEKIYTSLVPTLAVHSKCNSCDHICQDDHVQAQKINWSYKESLTEVRWDNPHNTCRIGNGQPKVLESVKIYWNNRIPKNHPDWPIPKHQQNGSRKWKIKKRGKKASRNTGQHALVGSECSNSPW